jgi:IS30 family transposase
MKYRTRTFYSDSQKAVMWERWREGATLHQIAKLFDRAHTSVQGILAASGGIRPAERHRAKVALTLAEREEISRAVVAGQSIRTVAALLGRAPSTVSREIKRNGGQECYRASQADQAAWDRGHRPKICKLAENRALARIVTDKLRMLWSPEQIAGWLKHTYLRDESHRVSHETIYRTLFIQARGALKKELLQHLRRTRGMRRWDRGKEMAGHKRFTLATDIQVYFCDPQNPWQRGTNENTNGLLRQYLPKGIDISNYSQAKLNAVARQLNERPRKTLGFQTPAEMFSQSVASTG